MNPQPQPDVSRETVLAEAERLINGERRDDYGPAEDSFSVIADLWCTYLRGKYGVVHGLDSTDIALMMALFKIARCATGGVKRDNLVDIGGYTGLAAKLSLVDR